MKSFQLVFTLVLITLVAITPSLAGKSATRAGLPTVTQTHGTLNSEAARMQVFDSDSKVKKAAPRSVTMDYTTASPVPQKAFDVSSIPPMHGALTIPGGWSTLTWSTIESAINVLNSVGIDGNVSFELDNATFNEACGITFGSYTGNNTFTTTLFPKAGTAVTVNFVASNANGKGFSFNNANNVIINGVNSGGASLTLDYSGGVFPIGDAFASTIYITGGSKNVTVKNTSIQGNIQGPYATQTEGRCAIFLYGNVGDSLNQYIKIDSNTVTNATFGFKALNSALAVQSQHVWFTHNHVGGAYGVPVVLGALVEAVNDMHYDYNIIDGVEVNDLYWNLPAGPTEYNYVFTFAAFSAPGGGGFLFNSGQYSAGHLYNCDAASTVAYNQVNNVHWLGGAEGGFITYGLVVRVGGAVLVHDNRIQGVVNTDPAGNTIGFRISTPKVYHNTVRFTGAHANILTTCLNMDAGDARNNAFSNEFTGPSAANTRGINAPGGTCDYNAIYSNGNPVGSFATWAASLIGDPTHNQNSVFGPINLTADLHVAGGPSVAENIGLGGLLALPDVDGDVRSVTTPDAGADEFGNTGILQAVDIFPYQITSPLAGGIPAGLPVPVTVKVKNNSNQAVTGAMLTVTINDVPTTFGPSALPTIPSNGSVTYTFGTNWNPPGGSWTIAATTSGVTDANPSNDTYSRAQLVSPAVNPAPFLLYTWDAGAAGWTGSVDWGTAPRTFTKLGGVYGGTGTSWVTNCPLDPGTYTEGALANNEGYSSTYPGANILTSPWFNLSTLGPDVYISGLQSIATEPGWDGSFWEYSTDGVHWKHLGVANDPNGVNWYNSSVYQNSPSWDASGGGPPDTATMALYGVGTVAGTTVPMGWWSSNGYPGPPVSVQGETGTPLGPFGYVFQQLHITAATYPDIVGAPLVKFRLVAFSDAVNPPATSAALDTVGARLLGMQGWAFDNFRIGSTGSTFPGGSISGTVFRDLDNNGADNGEPGESGITVNLLYFGVLSATTVTDVNGNFTFDSTKVKLPGTYSVQAVHAGFAFTTPNPTAGVNDPADGTPASVITGLLIGDYQGSISGTKWNDLNHNGVKDGGEPGLSGWTIQLRKDSCTGTIITTTVTDSLGNYSFVVLPGTYYVTEVQQNFWRQTFPANNCSPITTTTPSGSPSAVVTGVNFGNWNFGVFTIHKYIDINGNGVDDGAADHTAMPTGAIGVITITRNGNPFLVDTMGNGVSVLVHAGLDTGTYVATETFTTPPWYNTFSSGATFVVNTSGATQTAEFLNFKAYSISGTKYEDLNGNGVKDVGEPGLSGVTVNIDGLMAPGGTPSAVTDSNGNYTISKVGGAVHHITEVVPTGYVKTAPVADSVVSNYVVLWTGAGTGVYTAKPIGDFKTICISGVKYRDRNHDGQREAGEEGLDSVQINVTGTGATSVYTDVNGNWQICGLGPGSHTVTETAVPGFVQTQPAPSGYIFTASSHSNVTGLNFGNFKITDSTYLYRSFSSDDLEKGAQEKSSPRPKTGKPIGPKNPYIKPNIRNVVDDYFSKTQLGVVQVGLSGVNNALGKPKAYIYINSSSDFLKSLWDKGSIHDAGAESLQVFRGLDFTDKLKPLVGKQKNFSPKVQKNDLAAELIVLAFNLGLEAKVKVPAGFGNLIYNDGLVEPSECTQYGFPLNGKTILQIKAIGDNIMTNFEFVPLSCYKRLADVVTKINQSFSCGGVDCETPVEPKVDSTSWVNGVKLTVQGIYPLTAVSYFRANPGIAPVTPPLWQELAVPKAYALYQNYPNPFNPTTTIQFDLPEAATVTVKIYNILGQEVATLLNHQSFDAGNQSVEFDASRYASGVYLYRLVAERSGDNGISTGQAFTQVKKMVLLK